MSWPEAFAPGAIRDVEDVVDWLIDNGGPQVARRLAGAIVEPALRVVGRPLIGHSRPELLPSAFRFWAIQGFSYMLVYDASVVPPKVLRVLHMSRDLAPLLAGLGDRADGPGSG